MIVTELKDFIGIFDEVIPDDFCDYAVKHFEYAEKLSLIYDRQSVEGVPETIKKDDTHFAIDDSNTEIQIANSEIYSVVQKILSDALNIYIREYSVLEQVDYGFFTYRLQRTKVGGGYHAWHHERGRRANESRFITAILYLNDVEEGGETEFLYYHKRVKPKKARLVLFPCEYTHTHRGNPPLSNEKYIITTWGNYTK